MRAEESPGADGDCTSIDGTFDLYDRASLFHADRRLSDASRFDRYRHAFKRTRKLTQR